MRRILAILGSAIFLVIAPGIVAGYVPWWICRWHVGAPLLEISPLRVLGVLLVAAGLPVLLDSFARFALQGLGTPAPIFPTRHLVVSGLFRYVRNPMYVAVRLAVTARLALAAAQKMFSTMGGSVLPTGSRAERLFRDLQAMSSHFLLQPDSIGEAYGRLLLGLELPPGARL